MQRTLFAIRLSLFARKLHPEASSTEDTEVFCFFSVFSVVKNAFANGE